MAAHRLLIGALFLLVVPLSGCDTANASNTAAGKVRIEKVTLNGEEFKLELAANNRARTKGLMGRKKIERNGGMLFVFPDSQLRSFWMKNCITDMDIAFLDPQGRITAIHEMKVEPPQKEGETEFEYELRLKGYSSIRRAQFAIELAPGRMKELKLKVGEKVPLELRRLKKLAR